MASRNRKTVHLFNCDNLCNLSEVKSLLRAVGKKVAFHIKIEEHPFRGGQITDVVEKTIPSLRDVDYVVFVVHASECCLTFNEDSGYGKIYGALKRHLGLGKSLSLLPGEFRFCLTVSDSKALHFRFRLRLLRHCLPGLSFPGNSSYRLTSKLIKMVKNLCTIFNALLSCNSHKNRKARLCY